MDRIINAFNYFYKFLYFYYWLCYEVIQRIRYRGYFYIVTTIENGSDVTIRPMLHESFVKEKTEYIQKLAKRLPQEEFIEEALREALYTIRFLIFLVPRSNSSKFIQFLFDYEKPGDPFMLEINALLTLEDHDRIEKAKKLLQDIHYYPFTQDETLLRKYMHDFVGFYHHKKEEDIEWIHIYFNKSKIKEAAHITSLLMQSVFQYKGKLEVTVGDALDEYRHND